MATIDHSLAMVDLAGGPQIMCEKMNKAFSDGNLQWTLELADHLIITKNCVSVAKVRDNVLTSFEIHLFKVNGLI